MSAVQDWEVAWSRQLWDALRDRGVWGVPRSGLVFEKREPERQFVVTARMPHEPAMMITPAQLTEQQDDDVEAIRRRFAELDIEVVDQSKGE